MRPDKKLQVLGLGWLAVIVLLASQAGATEQAAGPLRSACAASDAAQSAVTPGREEILSPRLSDLEQRLFDQIHDGRFGEFSLLEAGLIAGGVDRDDELRRYRKRFDALVESLRRSGKVRGTPRERAQAVFAFLHQSILRGGYNLQASDLRQAFDHGRFNCVTASLLFNCLAERFELKAVGLEIPGHAMSRLELPEETLDIETTCPRWFADRPADAAIPRHPAGGRDGGPGRTGRDRRPATRTGGSVAAGLGSGIGGDDLLQPRRRSAGRKTLCRRGCRQCQGRAAGSGKRHRQRQFSRHDQQLGHRPGHVGRI